MSVIISKVFIVYFLVKHLVLVAVGVPASIDHQLGAAETQITSVSGLMTCIYCECCGSSFVLQILYFYPTDRM